ncbi:hypothetical protein NM208_g15554 [Fusarium decemcellulare]|uniref:Uncharacterized protein n=1 Tax=Fusarium decemcellulare TaxID=57161 RepID=A0ACC1RG36_9HYPO|nr:hypothetical protein NM208_g15554 [Fusarium decemcellulare]
MAPPQDEEMLDPSSSSESESQFESEDEVPQKKPTIALYDKDSDEEELERLVLGNKAGFRAQLFKDGGLFDSSREAEGKELELAVCENCGCQRSRLGG